MEAFDTVVESKVLVERRGREYNHIRLHSAMGYRPPVPEAIIPIGARVFGSTPSPLLTDAEERLFRGGTKGGGSSLTVTGLEEQP